MKKTTDPRIIAFDMDGTLLNKRHHICFRTFFYLRKLNKMGHHIVIASGRPSRAILKYYNRLGLSSPLICYNGAYVYSPKDENFKPIKYEFPKEVISGLTTKLSKNIINIMCENDTDIWVDKEDKYLDKYFWYKNMNIHVGSIKNILNENPMTCIAHTPYEYRESNEVHEFLKPYPKIAARFWIGSPYFELFYKETSKGAALKNICEYYGISTKNLIVFGDSINDVEMFDAAGFSVVMSNVKHEELKEKVDMISLKDNNHDGIYYTLKKILRD